MISINHVESTTEANICKFFARNCIPPMVRPIGEWAEKEIVIPSGPFEGYPYSLETLPYAPLLLNEFGKWAKHVVTGPSQAGKSLNAFVLVIMYYVFEKQMDVIVGIPDLNMSGDKWNDIESVISKSSYKHLLPKKGQGSKGASKVVKIEFLNGRSLRFMSGGGGDKQRAAATAQALVVTETDGLDTVSANSQEGQTKIQQLLARLNSFGDDALAFFECTVSTEDAFTWSNYKSGTASFIVHKCVDCEEYVSPEREHFVGWEDAQNVLEARENGRFSCPECGVLYSEDDRLKMNQSSVLLHRGQSITSDGEITGDIPPTDTFSFRWSAFQNLLTPMTQIAAGEWTARNSEDPEVADIARKQQVWVIPAEDPNVEKVPISDSIVRGSETGYQKRCLGLEQGELPKNTETVTAFIDCHKQFLQWSVESKYDKRIHVVDYGVFYTESPEIVGEEQAIEDAIVDLGKEISSKYPELKCGLIDAGNWPETIFKASKKLSLVWHPSHGLPKYKHPIKNDRNKKCPKDGNRHWHRSKNGRTWVVNFNPDSLKHRVHSGFLIRPLADDGSFPNGSITLFGSNPKTHTEFAKHVNAEVWITEFVKGKGVKTFWKKLRKSNHLFDCCVGNVVARLYVKSEKPKIEQAVDAQPEQAESKEGFIRKPQGRKRGFIRRRS